MYGLDVEQFRSRIVRPVLQDIGLWSPASENLVLGTAMKETHLRYLQQIRGPAVSLYQFEQYPYELHRRWLDQHPELKARVDAFAIGPPDYEELHGNLYYATAMCRIWYRAVPEALPPSDNALAMTQYWKRYYNTAKGKGTVEEALKHFQRAVQCSS